MRKHFVTYHSPGTFLNESTTKEIDSWDVKKAVEMSKDVTERYSSRPYGFSFETRLCHDDIDDGEGGKLKVESKSVERSGTYFLGGKLETYDEAVKRDDPKEETLRWNMKANGYWIVCINTNSYKSTQPFTEKDFIIDDDGDIIEDGGAKKFAKYRAKMEEQKEREYQLKFGK